MSFNRGINLTGGIKPPCKKDCPDRKQACHCSCEKYIKYEAEKAEYNEKALKSKLCNYDYIAFKKEAIHRMVRSR